MERGGEFGGGDGMGLQAFVRFFLPKEDRFFDFLEQQATKAHEGAVALAKFKEEGVSAQQVREAVQAIEHAGDKIMHDMEEALARTFVTPMDREDLQRLSSELDDILDLMNGAARACVLLGVNTPTLAMRKLMEKLVECTQVIQATVPNLRKHDYGNLLTCTREIRRLEKEGDAIYRDAVQVLFRDTVDAKVILREKEVLEDLERAMDHCEKVGDVFAEPRRSSMVKGGMLALLVTVIVAAIVFDYINGFHDAANAIATVVSTGVLPVRTAVLLAGVFNFVGAITGTAVAKTIAAGFADPGDRHADRGARRAHRGDASGTWSPGGTASRRARRTRSSAGSPARSSRRPGLGAFKWGALAEKVLMPLVVSPAARLHRRVLRDDRARLDLAGVRGRLASTARSRRLQLVSACMMAFSHGSNDAQKSMGIITLALVAFVAAGHAGELPAWMLPAAGTTSRSG